MATCEERIDAALAGRLDDLGRLWSAGGDEVEDLGNLADYGLSFEYVQGSTDYNPEDGYFRYQLSWGGPADEFRYYAHQARRGWEVARVEYWFLDWADGASRTLDLTTEAGLLMTDLFYHWFDDCGAADVVFDAAMEAI